MKIYVIGPVSGMKDRNIDRFVKASSALQAAGYETAIPHDYVRFDAEWEDAMKASIKRMLDADGVAMLNGWHDSRGASLEYDVARKVGIPAYGVEFWLANASRFAKGGAR